MDRRAESRRVAKFLDCMLCRQFVKELLIFALWAPFPTEIRTVINTSC